MSKLTANRLNLQLSAEDLTEINDHLDAILAKLPQLGLTPEQRKSYRGLKAANRTFAQDCINVLKTNGAELMPGFVDPQNLINDYELYRQLDALSAKVENVRDQVGVSQRIAGKEAADQCYTVLRYYKIAAEAGVPDAKASYEQLAGRFKKGGRKKD